MHILNLFVCLDGVSRSRIEQFSVTEGWLLLYEAETVAWCFDRGRRFEARFESDRSQR